MEPSISYSIFKKIISKKAQRYCESNNIKYMCQKFINWCEKNSIDDLYHMLISEEMNSSYDLTYVAESYGVKSKDKNKVKKALFPLLKHKNAVIVEGVLLGLYDLSYSDLEVKKEIRKIYPHNNKVVNSLISDMLSSNLELFK